MSSKGAAAIFKGAGVIAVIVLVCKLLGFIEKWVLGNFLGATYETDVYLAAFIFLIVFHEFAKGVAQPFLPVMSGLKEKHGEAEAWKLFSVLANIVVIPLLLISIVAVIYAEPIARDFYGTEKPTKAAVAYDSAAMRLEIYPVEGSLYVEKSTAREAVADAEKGVGVWVYVECKEGKVSLLTRKISNETQSFAEQAELAAQRAGVLFANDVSQTQLSGLMTVLKNKTQPGIIAPETFEKYAKPVTLEHKIKLLAKLIQIMFLGATFLGLSAFTYLLLNSEKRFFAPALGDLTFKVLGLVGLLALMKWTGVVGGAIGVAVGGVGYLAVNIAALWRKRALYRFTLDWNYKPLTDTLKLMAPLVVYMIFYLGRQLVDIYYAMSIEGGYSALQYGFKLIEFPHRTMLEPFAIALFPTLALLAVENKDEEFADLMQLGLRAIALVFVPAACCLFIMRHEVVAMLWPNFTETAYLYTAVPLGLYAFAMIPLALEIVLTKALIAKKDTWVPAYLELVAAAVHIGVIEMLRESFQGAPHASIALGFTASRAVKLLLMYAAAKRRVRDLKVLGDLLFLLKIGGAFAVMFCVMYYSREQVMSWLNLSRESGVKNQALVILPVSLLGAAVFFGLVAALKVPELRGLIRMIKDRKKNKAAAKSAE